MDTGILIRRIMKKISIWMLIVASVWLVLPFRAMATVESEIITYDNLIQEMFNEFDNLSPDLWEEWYLGLKEINDEYCDCPEMSTIYDCYSEEEIQLMLWILENEIGSGTFEEKVNVSNVFFNREKSDEFSNNMKELLTKDQFCIRRSLISEDTVLALEFAFIMDDTTNGSIAFHSMEKTSTFNGWVYVFTDGSGHNFYKIKEKNEENYN